MFALVFTACGGGGGSSSSTPATTTSGSGTFTLTDIPPEFNGQYAYLLSYDNSVDLYSAQSINIQAETAKGVLISGGKVSLPMWIIKGNSAERYSGNHTVDIEVYGHKDIAEGGFDILYTISGGVFFESVTFSNGSATRSVNQADDSWEGGY